MATQAPTICAWAAWDSATPSLSTAPREPQQCRFKPPLGRCKGTITHARPTPTRLHKPGLSLFYVVSACHIPKGNAVRFSHQMEVTQTPHSPLLRCDAPDTLLVAGSAASIDVPIGKLGALGHDKRVSRTADCVTISALLPTASFQILSLVAGTDLVIRAVTGWGAVVYGVGDRLASCVIFLPLSMLKRISTGVSQSSLSRS